MIFSLLRSKYNIKGVCCKVEDIVKPLNIYSASISLPFPADYVSYLHWMQEFHAAQKYSVFNFRELSCTGRCKASEIIGLKADRWSCHIMCV